MQSFGDELFLFTWRIIKLSKPVLISQLMHLVIKFWFSVLYCLGNRKITEAYLKDFLKKRNRVFSFLKYLLLFWGY